MADQKAALTPAMTKKKKSLTKDLTNGNPMSLILGFSVPLLFGMLFQQFYSLVDTIIVGKCIDANALAAVGSTGSINFLIIGFCIGICSGFSIPVAQRFGAGDYAGMRKMVWNGAWLSCLRRRHDRGRIPVLRTDPSCDAYA